jgi:hypothetical protein
LKEKPREQKNPSPLPKNLETYRQKHGKPDSSMIMDIELLLEKFAFQREAYHGGDFNGVCCRRIIGNAVS